jgi:RNA polymerase sigma-70 factor (ECF subfamily)
MAPGAVTKGLMGQLLAVQLEATDPAPAVPLTFEGVYQAHFDFVWRNLRRLGVRGAATDDAAQDVFLVVHRRLHELPPTASVAAWLYGVLRKVAAGHRRTARRRDGEPLPETGLPQSSERSPDESAARAQASRWLAAFLEGLPAEQRDVFVLMELEQLAAPEVAHALEVSVNTIYSRLRLARQRFDRALAVQPGSVPR